MLADRFAQVFRDEHRKIRDTLLDLLSAFLPEQLTDDEVDALIADAIEQTGATSMREIGKVMGAVMAKAKGKADGNLVQQKVRERLEAG